MRLIFIPLCCLILTLAVSAQKFDTTYYSVVTNDFIQGEQKSWKENPDEYHYLYYENDRGRGRNIHETIHTNASGQIISANVTGVDYLKNPYSSKFYIQNDSAIWFINNTRNSIKYNNQLYSIGSAPGEIELNIRWLLKQPNLQTTNLQKSIVRLKDIPVTNEISLNGKTASLKLFGRYFNSEPLPDYLWLTEDLRFFGDIGYKGGIIMKGYESWIDSLFALQELADKDYYHNQLKELSYDLKNHIFITNANLFVSSTAITKTNMTVEILNGKIKSISPTSNKKNLQADTLIDAKGKFLMPGLWDMHCHYSKNDGLWYLAGGVTHVRDMATPEITQTTRQQIESNELLGPDISYISGLIDGRDSLQAPTGKIVSTLKEGIEAIDYYHKRGYDQIKLYSSIKPEWVKPMADHAHSLGMRVSGHVPAYMTAAQAISAGYNEITHNNMIFLNFMGADTLATNGIARLRIPALLSGTIDLQSNEVRSFIQLMKQKSISHDPTLGVQEGLYDEFVGDTSHRIKPIINWMPESEKSDLAKTSSAGSENQKPAYKASFRNAMAMVKMLFDNGILLVAGTDGGDAIALHRELEIYNGRMYSPKKLLGSRGWKYYY